MLSKTVALFLALGSASLAAAQGPVGVGDVSAGRNESETVAIRLEIDNIYRENRHYWHLVVQAMIAMQNADFNDPMSYFQISGIHGWPFVGWNGNGPGQKQESSGWKGYCPHGEQVFLPWHRAYLQQFELSFRAHVMGIAQSYPNDVRAEYMAVAETVRIPYWYWAGSEAVPRASIPPTLNITTPNGPEMVRNPYASYQLPEEALEKYGEDILSSTRRSRSSDPNTIRCAAPQSYPESADNALSLSQNGIRSQGLRNQMCTILLQSKTFADFASTGSGQLSLEMLHNSIHVEATCGGDLLYPAISGFEPLLMLHHATIDLIWSLYQDLYPNEANLKDSYIGYPRLTTPRGSRIGPDSPLDPFRGPDGKPHTSKTVASIQNLGYVYFGYQKVGDNAALKQGAIKLFNDICQAGKGIPNEMPDANSPLGGKPGALNQNPLDNSNSSLPENGPDNSPLGGDSGALNRNPLDDSNSPLGGILGAPDRNPLDDSNSPLGGNLGAPDQNALDNSNSPLAGNDISRPSLGDNPNDPQNPPGSTLPDGFNGADGNPPNRGPDGSRPLVPGTGPNTNGPQNTTPGGSSGVLDNSEHNYAYVTVDVSEIPRPCFLNIYIGDDHAGSTVVMAQPAEGPLNAAILLDDAIKRYTAKVASGTLPPVNGTSLSTNSTSLSTNGTSLSANGTSLPTKGTSSLVNTTLLQTDDTSEPNGTLPGANGTMPEFFNNIHCDFTTFDGQRIEGEIPPSLNVTIAPVRIKRSASPSELPVVEYEKPKVANNGIKLTTPPNSGNSNSGPAIFSGAKGGDGDDSCDAPDRPKDRKSSASAMSESHSAFLVVFLAVISLVIL